MGWETVAFIEKDEFCQKVLAKNFPGVPIYGDIQDYRGERGSADIICGGFPCQPFSVGGKRKGTSDDRHLWPQMLRVIQESAPRYVVAENVYGLLTWSNGMVFDQVQFDLENAGYAVWPAVLPACALNAPHRRERLWVVGHLNSRHAVGEREPGGADQGFTKRPTAQDFQKWNGGIDELVTRDVAQRADSYAHARRVLDGIPDRMDRLKALGNSIVPRIAFEIFRAIERASNP